MSALILIIEDNPEDREAARLSLSEAAQTEGLILRFSECGSGEAGLAACHSETPKCILLDHNLPDMDGLEFLRRLKAGAQELPIPVVVLTGSVDRSLATDALRAGAHEYLPKRSIEPETLFRAVKSAQDRFKLIASDVAVRESESRLREVLASRQSELEQLVSERTAALVQAEAQFHGIFDSQFQFISLLDPGGTVIEMNRTALDATTLDRDDVIGRSFWDIPWWSIDQRPSVRQDIAMAPQIVACRSRNACCPTPAAGSCAPRLSLSQMC